MLNPVLADIFARQHRQELLDTAARIRLASLANRADRPRLRVRAGWRLVQAGLRLALVDGQRAPSSIV